MKHGLTLLHAKDYACELGLILQGFSVADDHSIVLCEQGFEHAHSKKRTAQEDAGTLGRWAERVEAYSRVR